MIWQTCGIIGLDTLIEGQGGGGLNDADLKFSISGNQHRKYSADIAGHAPSTFLRQGWFFMDQIGLTATQPLADILNAAPNDIRVICGHVPQHNY